MNLQPSRRALLERAALAPLAVALPGVVLPARSYAAPEGGVDLPSHERQARVKAVRAYSVPGAVFVQVTADDGTSGWGEAGHSGGPLVAAVVERVLRERVVDQDVFAAETTWARMFYEADELGPGGLASQAIAGVDCALWDLRGKLLGLPVWALLGGKFRDSIPLYGSFTRGHQKTPSAASEMAEALVDEGFQALKFRLDIREENQDPTDDPAVPFVRAIRRAIGEKVPLYIDANNGYSPSRAIEIGQILAKEFNVNLFEEPVAAYQYASLAKVADALEMPVAAGEHEYTRWQFRDLILQGRVDVLNPDVSKLAGLTEAKKVATLAEVFDLPISVHNARPTLLTAAHLHFVASAQTAHRLQEHPSRDRLSDLWNYFENRFSVSADGTIRVPDGPGLGLVANEGAIRAAAE
jgi:L-alanine-DL-glutamate epimerase-like enolase superfamily enzyme